MWDGAAFTDHAIQAGQMLLAAACGALVGWERERREKGAGLRTHILMCMGACLFALILLRMHEDFPTGDALRLLQGLLIGVGFLAGGVIFTQGATVRGLTTAAGLWLLTAVGLAIGLSYYFLAALGTLLAFGTIAGLKPFESHLHDAAHGPPKDSADRS